MLIFTFLSTLLKYMIVAALCISVYARDMTGSCLARTQWCLFPIFVFGHKPLLSGRYWVMFFFLSAPLRNSMFNHLSAQLASIPQFRCMELNCLNGQELNEIQYFTFWTWQKSTEKKPLCLLEPIFEIQWNCNRK